jgi:lipoyl(octanoyl) transferase
MVSAEILVARCGLVPYEEALALQGRLEAARQRDELPDVLLLLEHQPVYTRGRRSTPAELPMGVEWYELQGIEVRDTDRGGRVTYHGPGQLVAYPIVSLRPYDDDVHEYVRRLERVALSALAGHGVEARTIEGLTGVWTMGEPPGSSALRRAGNVPMSDEIGPSAAARDRRAGNVPMSDEIGPSAVEARKIGSIGVHVSRGVTTHGLAVNVNNDLQPFEWIVPCGIEGARATSVSRERGSEQDLDGFASTVAERFGELFERDIVDVEHAELASTGSVR